MNGANLSDNPIDLVINKEDILNNIYSLVDNNVKYVTPDQILTALLPLGNFSNFTEFVDFNKIGVNYSNLQVEDGNYTLKLLYTDKYGNRGEMPFTLILDITNEGAPETSDIDGTLIFNDLNIKQTLQRIENLPSGINLSVILFGRDNPPSFIVPPSNVQPLNYIDITSSNSTATSSGSFDLYFKIAKNSISSSAKNDVRMYVQEGSSWILLPNSLIGETSTHMCKAMTYVMG